MKGLLIGVLGLLACGPIEAEPPKPNRPPYIPPDRVRPDQNVVSVDALDGGVVTLEVTELLDPNDEGQLSYVWLGDERSFQREGDVGDLSTTEINGERYYTFQSISLEIDPCQVVGDGTRKETIWLYISDRDFEVIDGTGREGVPRIVPRANAYLASRTWVLEYAPQLCTN